MTAPPGPAAQAAPNRLVRNVIIASILGALVFAALSAYGDVDALRTRLGEFQVGAFLIALALVTGNIALRFGRWELYLRYLGLRVGLLESVLVFLSGFVMSVTPAKLGEVLKSVLLWESHRVPIERSAPIVLAERFTDLIALLLIMAVGATRFSFGLPLALGGFLLCGFILTVCLWERLGVALLGTIGRVPRLGGLAARLQAAYAALRSLCLPGPLLAATALALLGWSLEVLAAVQIVQGFGAAPSTMGVSFAYASSQVAGALAMMPGGLGVTEAGMAALLGKVGSDAGLEPAVAAGVTILFRLATLWWAVLLGLVALPLHRSLRRRIPRP